VFDVVVGAAFGSWMVSMKVDAGTAAGVRIGVRRMNVRGLNMWGLNMWGLDVRRMNVWGLNVWGLNVDVGCLNMHLRDSNVRNEIRMSKERPDCESCCDKKRACGVLHVPIRSSFREPQFDRVDASNHGRMSDRGQAGSIGRAGLPPLGRCGLLSAPAAWRPGRSARFLD